MNHSHKLDYVLKKIILDDNLEINNVNDDIINAYKELNLKCKKILIKVKKRKLKDST